MRNELMYRETIEWSNAWWEQANNLGCKRILMIGDSVTRGIRPRLHKIVTPDYVVDLFASSLQITDSLLEKEINFHFSVREYLCDKVIIQQGGQHGFDRRCSDDKEFCQYFRNCYLKLISQIESFCDKIIFLSATATVLQGDLMHLDEDRNVEIVARNEIVKEVATIKNKEYIDIYNMTEACKHVDQIHLDQECYERVAKKIVEVL